MEKVSARTSTSATFHWSVDRVGGMLAQSRSLRTLFHRCARFGRETLLRNTAHEVRFIYQTTVYAVTLTFSLFAYLWVLIIVQLTSPEVRDAPPQRAHRLRA